MAKLKLEVDYDYSFLLFGICSHVRDYRLCHHINKVLGINLVKKKDIKLPDSKSNETLFFSNYEWHNRTKEITYQVVSNRGENAYLINEEHKTDYFLKVEGSYLIVKNKELLEKIKRIPVVLTAYELEPESMPSKQNFFFE